MKKTLANLSGVNILSKQEQKAIKGGASCAVFIPKGTPFGSTDWHATEGGRIDSSGTTLYGLSKGDAVNLVSNGGRWCCDSCNGASWYKDPRVYQMPR